MFDGVCRGSGDLRMTSRVSLFIRLYVNCTLAPTQTQTHTTYVSSKRFSTFHFLHSKYITFDREKITKCYLDCQIKLQTYSGRFRYTAKKRHSKAKKETKKKETESRLLYIVLSFAIKPTSELHDKAALENLSNFLLLMKVTMVL